jgi:hypothetical protein
MKNANPVSNCLLFLMLIHPFLALAFVPSFALRSTSTTASTSTSSSKSKSSRSWLGASVEDDTDSEISQASDLLTPKELFPTAEFKDLEIKRHRPLGCTVEESLADHPVTNIVFVSKVVEGGSSEKAGLQAGDVLIGLTGMFGEMELVTGMGVAKIKGLVASVPDTEPLTMRVARGTQVMAQHEEALEDLCAGPSTSDKEVEECMLEYLTQGYNYQPDDDEMECDADDDDTECLLDALHSIWYDDLPPPETTLEITDQPDQAAKKVKPWSSRSSGSGTYVVDPETGKMRNIDPQ